MTQSKTDNIVLQAKSISKTFGGIKALDSVSLEIYKGQVNAIVGENGAGKSTLMKVLTGIHQPRRAGGQIFLDGLKVTFANPKEAQESGIAIIHQELNLIPYLSVAYKSPDSGFKSTDWSTADCRDSTCPIAGYPHRDNG